MDTTKAFYAKLLMWHTSCFKNENLRLVLLSPFEMRKAILTPLLNFKSPF